MVIACKTWIFIFFMLLCGHFSSAQSQITFRQLSVKDGLSQNSVVSITQDSVGYLWMATQDGLNQYDGQDFKIFPHAFVDITRPTYSHLGKVYTGRRGEVWIIPENKIPQKLNRDTEEFLPIPNVEDASIVYQDKNFNVWFGTHSKGVYLLKANDSLPKRVFSESRVEGPVYGITENSGGNIIFAKQNGLLTYHFHEKELKNLEVNSIYDNKIKANFSDVIYDETGSLWVSTFGDGLYFKEQNSDIFQRIDFLQNTDPLPTDLNITDLYLDQKNRLWIATYGSGLYMLNLRLKTSHHFEVAENNPRTLHYNDILCIYEDYTGTVWFGTDGAGISYFDEYLEKFNSLTNFQTPSNISIDVVRAITVDDNGSIWIGTSGKGLTQYEPSINSWRTFKSNTPSKNRISSDRIMSLFSDKNFDLWIGTQGAGLNILSENGQFKSYDKNSSIKLTAETIWDIFKGENSRMWLATRGQGLIEFDKEKGEVKKYQVNTEKNLGPPGNNIRVISKSRGGKLWLGTEEDGLALFDPISEKFTWFQRNNNNQNSLPSNKIKSLYEDPAGILWIGTNGSGLVAFDTKENSFHQYTINDGLANNVIYAIQPDEENNLWLSSNKGITKFKSNFFKTSPEIINYSNYDGLATEFNTGAYYKDEANNLYFGGLDGFYWFNPKKLKDNKILPKTAITGLEVFNETRPLTENQELAYSENTLTFTFSSLQFSLPEKNQYQYRLLNYDDEWVNSGNINLARYSQLPSGNYTFQVKSSNYDGVWNELPTEYKFSIRTPWYLSVVAKIIYSALFLGLVLGFYSYLKWRLKMRLNLQLQEEEAARLKRLNDFKSKLYTDVSHEFRTPLTLISGPIDAKLSEGALSQTDFANFSMIKRNTKRLISLVDQLLHLAKLEKGKLKLRIVNGNIGLFLAMLSDSFQYDAELKNIEYHQNISNLASGWYDEDALEKIVGNLLSNALKHGLKGGKCIFTANSNQHHMLLSVKNTIDSKTTVEVEKIFTRFYQKDEHNEGAGVGLSLVKELVNLYQGSISVQIENENTIHFQLQLPYGKSAFAKIEKVEVIDEVFRHNKNVFSESIDINIPTVESKEDLPIVLIVEDHKEVRDFIKSVWVGRFQIFEAKDGREGIDKALEIVPDLIITDIRMPNCDGIELCNTIKTDERTSHVPIILLTAGIGEEQELKGLKSGADDFITKPFKLMVLEAKVNNLIASRNALRERYSQEVVLRPKDIALTPTDVLFFERVQKVLAEHLTNSDFSAELFCKHLGMSRMQLHRKLMAFTGLSASAFIRSQRLKQAVHILSTSDASINEVAYSVGFNTPSYFIKCFKEAYKKTPLEYLETFENKS